MVLNQDLSFDHVRWSISPRSPGGRVVSYDKRPAFKGPPMRILLGKGQHLFRLDYLATNEWPLQVWWMREHVFRTLLHEADDDAEKFRTLAKSGLALPSVWSKPLPGSAAKEEKYDHLAVTQIVLKQPCYGWFGLAAAYSNQRRGEFEPGGLEQVLLPNLHIRGDQYHSNHASLVHTYSIAVK